MAGQRDVSPRIARSMGKHKQLIHKQGLLDSHSDPHGKEAPRGVPRGTASGKPGGREPMLDRHGERSEPNPKKQHAQGRGLQGSDALRREEAHDADVTVRNRSDHYEGEPDHARAERLGKRKTDGRDGKLKQGEHWASHPKGGGPKAPPKPGRDRMNVRDRGKSFD